MRLALLISGGNGRMLHVSRLAGHYLLFLMHCYGFIESIAIQFITNIIPLTAQVNRLLQLLKANLSVQIVNWEACSLLISKGGDFLLLVMVDRGSF